MVMTALLKIQSYDVSFVLERLRNFPQVQCDISMQSSVALPTLKRAGVPVPELYDAGRGDQVRIRFCFMIYHGTL